MRKNSTHDALGGSLERGRPQNHMRNALKDFQEHHGSIPMSLLTSPDQTTSESEANDFRLTNHSKMHNKMWTSSDSD